jgi:hypothetical protein
MVWKMVKENIIIWQKWSDPFGGDDDDLDQAFDDQISEEPFEDEEGNEDQQVMNKSLFKKQSVKVIATPMGIIPMNDNTASGKIFNFWIGHTNFDITKKIAQIIESIAGVETLDVFTRYRFRVAIGKAFNDSEVMRDINDKIYTVLEDD